jgi:hypothetical protein
MGRPRSSRVHDFYRSRGECLMMRWYSRGVLLLRKIAGMLEQRLLAVRSLQHRERERDLRARDDRLAACVKKLRKKTTVEPPKKAEKVGPAKSTFCSMIWRRERDSNPRNRFRFSGFQDHRHRPLGHPSRLRKPTSPRLLRRGSPKRRRRDGGRVEIRPEFARLGELTRVYRHVSPEAERS